jgi:hypothetical protein
MATQRKLILPFLYTYPICSSDFIRCKENKHGRMKGRESV